MAKPLDHGDPNVFTLLFYVAAMFVQLSPQGAELEPRPPAINVPYWLIELIK